MLKTFLNPRRLRDYPILMLLVSYAILSANLAFHQGWRGGLGQIIGSDFITLYAQGLIQQAAPSSLYDFEFQRDTQAALIAPTALPGLNPFISPPYVASAYSLLTFLPLPWAFGLWTLFTFLCAGLAAIVMERLYSRLSPQNNPAQRKSRVWRLLVVTLSFFPFVEGLQAGQNHALSLLLVSGLLLAAACERWALAGALAGCLIYKPQLAIGLLVVWLMWRNMRALAGFGGMALLWIGVYFARFGIQPFLDYLEAMHVIQGLPYVEGFPGYLITTLYGLLTSLLPEDTAGALLAITQVVFVLACGVLAWLAFRRRKSALPQRMPVLALAIVLPLAFSPYAQLHDLLLLIPVMVIWSALDASPRVLYAAVIAYVSAFFLPLIAATTGIAWMAFIPLGLFALISAWVWQNQSLTTSEQRQ